MINRCLGKTLSGQGGASFFVVGSLRIVNGIMKPDRQFNRERLSSEMASSVELAEALGQMNQVMIVPMRFGVVGAQLVEPGLRIAGHTELAPQSIPSFSTGEIHTFLFRNCR